MNLFALSVILVGLSNGFIFSKRGQCQTIVTIYNEQKNKSFNLVNIGGTWPWGCGKYTIGSAKSTRACSASTTRVTVLNSTYKWDKVGKTSKTGANGCTSKLACKLAFGNATNVNQCQFGSTDKTRWKIRAGKYQDFCNANVASNDPTATALEGFVHVRKTRTKTALRCCTTGNLCNKNVLDVDDPSCKENTKYSTFMTEGNKCWNKARFKYIRQISCTNETRDYIENCRDEAKKFKRGKKIRGVIKCLRRYTCTPKLRKILTEFGNCMCNAPESKVFGSMIANTFEDNWGDICPGINLECNNNGTLSAKLRYKILKIALKLKQSMFIASKLNQTQIDKIKSIISKRLSVSTQDITVDTSSSTRRRLAGTNSVEVRVTGSEADSNAEMTSGLNGCTNMEGSDGCSGTVITQECDINKNNGACGSLTGDTSSNTGTTTAPPTNGANKLVSITVFIVLAIMSVIIV